MSSRTRTRALVAALLAVGLLSVGLASDAGARTEPVRLHDVRVVAHGARVAAPSAAHSERRAPLAKAGVVAARSGAASRWVHVLTASAAIVTAAVVSAPSRSRAPPA
jgi:hypothetical protein